MIAPPGGAVAVGHKVNDLSLFTASSASEMQNSVFCQVLSATGFIPSCYFHSTKVVSSVPGLDCLDGAGECHYGFQPLS